ncbi:hypothetical protein PGTUg99_002188 [Puccinia graminis f. sp. tritici]|uniref:Uncharacterized protein n=1 Tax=Puccinia graminis f. sp. tritici TaxID=56615 RepID=A0A5B0S2X9_PUCGR|nr:hypothetical protein PGTUg99_002188 [Puccinia graminis f. sp. tritici]
MLDSGKEKEKQTITITRARPSCRPAGRLLRTREDFIGGHNFKGPGQHIRFLSSSSISSLSLSLCTQVRPQFSSNSAGKSTISSPAVTQGQTAVEPLTNLSAWFIPAKNWANPLLKPGKFRANKPWPANKPQPANNPRGFESTTGLIVRHRISSDCSLRVGIRAFRSNQQIMVDGYDHPNP